MSNFSLLGETSSSMSDLSRGPASLHKPNSKSSLPEDVLHYAVWYGRASDIRRIIRDGGISVDTLNCHGQTPLFVAAYTQDYFTVKTLLALGANPNARCVAGYTPTHAAAYSGSRKILSKILEAGGDLRLHDENACTPIDWALWQSDGEKKLRIMELIDSARRCTMKQSGKDALTEKAFSRNMGGRSSLSTLFKRKLPVKGGKNGKQEVDMGELVKSIHAMGFGKMYFGNGLKAAAISTIPYIEPSDLSPDRHHPSYSSGSFTEMSSKLWLHTRVTVRSILEPPPAGALVDSLISELEALCKLTHPQILLLMGVCQTKNYEGLMLVFEHVQLGSLYYCLHEKNCMPKIKSAVDILLQVLDALIYLHSHGWLHCSLTSHAVHLVGPSVAKLSSFELAVEDKEETRRNRTLNLLSDKGWQSIYNWLCPEILRGESPSKTGDMYSLCCLIWEICTGQVPWGNLDPEEIIVEIKLKGHVLPLDRKYIPKHLLTVLEQGLKLRRDERDVNLHEIRESLILTRKNAVKNEKKELQPRGSTSTSSSAYSQRHSSTTDSGVWFGSESRPVRSYSSSAIQRSPGSSQGSSSYHTQSAAEEEEEDDAADSKSKEEEEGEGLIDEFTGLRKTSSILKRKKYDEAFGKLPSKTRSASHQNVNLNNYDYVQNRAKRQFLRHGCVRSSDYTQSGAPVSQEEEEENILHPHRRSLSSLYHDTLMASERIHDNGIDLLSSSSSCSTCDLMSPYLSRESIGGKRGSPHNAGGLRSRSVPRTQSSTIPVSNTAAEFVAAHLQEANKRGYGRTFSNLSQKSRENLLEEERASQALSDLTSKHPPHSKSNDIRPASHAIQRRSPEALKPTKKTTQQQSKTANKKDLVSSMSRLNLQLPVSKARTMTKNKSASSIRPTTSPRSPLKSFAQSKEVNKMTKITEDIKSKSCISLPSKKYSGPELKARENNKETKKEGPGNLYGKFTTTRKPPQQTTSSSSTSTVAQRANKASVLIRASKQKSLGELNNPAKGDDGGSSLQHWKKSRNLTESRSFSVGSLKSKKEEAISKENHGAKKLEAGILKKSFPIGGLAGKFSRKDPSYGASNKLILEPGKKPNYSLESKVLSSEGFTIHRVKPSVLRPLKKGPDPKAFIYSNTRGAIKKKEEEKKSAEDLTVNPYSAVSSTDRKPGEIIRSGDRLSSPPRSQWSTKGVQSLIQDLESIQQQKLQSVSLYQTAPSEPHVPQTNDLSRGVPTGQENQYNYNNEKEYNNLITLTSDEDQQGGSSQLAPDPWNDAINYNNNACPSSSSDPFMSGGDNNNGCNDWNTEPPIGSGDPVAQALYAQEPVMDTWDNNYNNNNNNNNAQDSYNHQENTWNTPVEKVHDCNGAMAWGNNGDPNLTQLNPAEDTMEMNNNNQNDEGPSSQEGDAVVASDLYQSPEYNKSSPPETNQANVALLRTSTPNDYKGRGNLQSAYSSAMEQVIQEEEEANDECNESGSSECWNTADGDLINLQEGMRSSSMVRQMDEKLSRRAEQNNVTFNSEVLEISNSVSTYTQTPNGEMLSSRRASGASSFLSQDTEDLYCDDELNPSLGNDPNMQLLISSHLQDETDPGVAEDYPQNPMFNDQDSILSMDIPSTGPTSLKSELSEDKDNYNTASSSEDEDEEGNTASASVEVEIASENTRNESDEGLYTTVSSFS